jgi:hypothetical protein
VTKFGVFDADAAFKGGESPDLTDEASLARAVLQPGNKLLAVCCVFELYYIWCISKSFNDSNCISYFFVHLGWILFVQFNNNPSLFSRKQNIWLHFRPHN